MDFKTLFNLDETIARTLIQNAQYPWECLPKIHDFIIELGNNLDKNLFTEVSENVWIAKTAKIALTACIEAPAIIDEEAEIRHCAYIRGNVIVGKNSVVGNSTELKNCILFNGVQVPHFNYVGDSILGYKVHLGAGVILSNVRNDKREVFIKKYEKNKRDYSGESNYSHFEEIKTNLYKVGAFLGDGVEIGCNSVLNPGTVVGKNAVIYPLSCVKGIVEENTIYKN